MSNITIGRYGPNEAKDADGHGFSAWIEGTDDTGKSWILWLDETGRPCTYYGDREQSGACIGERIDLAPYPWDKTTA
jgi:hypothetical protein